MIRVERLLHTDSMYDVCDAFDPSPWVGDGSFRGAMGTSVSVGLILSCKGSFGSRVLLRDAGVLRRSV
jgi:hypothetical protein